MKILVSIILISYMLFAGIFDCTEDTKDCREVNEFNKLSKECTNSAGSNSAKQCIDFIKYLKKTGDPYRSLGIAYWNLSIVYKNDKNYSEENNTLQHLLSINPYKANVNLRMGIKYYLGEGKNINYIKAYKYLHTSLKYGDLPEAQSMLKRLCTDNPWACHN